MAQDDIKHDPEVSVASFKSTEKETRPSAAELLAQYDPEDVKKAWRKVDRHIMPIAVLLYLASYIDRYVRRLLLPFHFLTTSPVQCEYWKCQSTWVGPRIETYR